MALSPILKILRRQDPRAVLGITGDWKSLLRLHFLYAALDSGLVHALQTPRSRDDLVELLGVHRIELLDALLELGICLGELGGKDDVYRLKGYRIKALGQERNDALAALIEANITYYNSVFRGFSRRLRGGPMDEGVGKIGGLVARASKIAEPYVEHFLQEVVRVTSPARILDVGCGSGTHLKEALEEAPGAWGIGVELDPEVAEQASANLEAWGLEDRARVVVSDIRDHHASLGGPFDLALFFSLAYYFRDEERVGVLRSVREQLEEGGALGLTVSCRGPGMDAFSANLNLATTSMEGLTALPTPEEMARQLREAGFLEVRRQTLAPGTTFFGFVAS